MGAGQDGQTDRVDVLLDMAASAIISGVWCNPV